MRCWKGLYNQLVVIEQIIRPCTSETCKMRELFKPKVVAAQEMVATWLDQNAQEPNPFDCLFLLGAAMCGGWDACKNRPANFARTVYHLAYDPHFATTDWLFTQEELALWPESDGWKVSGRMLTPDDAKKFLRHFPEIVDRIDTEDQAQYAKPLPEVGTFKSTVTVHQGDERGTATITHLHKEGLLDSLCTHVMTRGRFKDLGELGEVIAGRILRGALAGRHGLELGEVRKNDADFPDLHIEGLPWGVEHTKADSRPWSDLGKKVKGERWYSARESQASQFDAIDERVKDKARKYAAEDKAGVILLLDSCLLRLHPDTIAEYGRSREATLRESGFREVWFVCGFTKTAHLLFTQSS